MANPDSLNEYRTTNQWPFHISCGGAVYRRGEHGVEFLLLYRKPWHRDPFDSWHLPKGTLGRHETLEQCAAREVTEETGVLVEIEAYRGSLHGQWFDAKKKRPVDKTTHYFLCRYVDDSPNPMDDEHDSAEWADAETAIRQLQSMPKREGQIISRAVEWLNR
jgi:8-oxo-dGTP pyrophosphatase MutT (NUDIX family)